MFTGIIQNLGEVLKYSNGNFKNAEFLSKHILSIPLHPYMKLSDQDYIFKIFKKLR